MIRTKAGQTSKFPFHTHVIECFPTITITMKRNMHTMPWGPKEGCSELSLGIKREKVAKLKSIALSDTGHEMSPWTTGLSLKECMSSPGSQGRKAIPGRGHNSQTSPLANLQEFKNLHAGGWVAQPQISLWLAQL